MGAEINPPTNTTVTFVATKDLHLLGAELRAGVQQLLLSLGKHCFVCFLRENIVCSLFRLQAPR